VDAGATLALALAAILAAAAVGGHVAEAVGQPAVLGELVVGMLVGNLGMAGWAWPQVLAQCPLVDGLARLGVILLLFEVGLESTVGEMRRVGARAFVVAVLGVAAPWALGWGVGAAALPGRSWYVYLFLGAALTATSVGITARVLRDLGQSRSLEARIILGAAVIDDVLGLVILPVVGSMIQAADAGGTPAAAGVAWVLVKAVGFLAVALWAGALISPRVFALAARLRGKGTALAAALVPCFALAALASAVGLAPIVGAYTAGLVVEQAHYQPLADRGHRALSDLLHPLTSVLVPVFFVVMGMRVDLRALAQPQILALAGSLTLAAIAASRCARWAALGRRWIGSPLGSA
jgi:Kef-type K+ transport system membrane component KefB